MPPYRERRDAGGSSGLLSLLRLVHVSPIAVDQVSDCTHGSGSQILALRVARGRAWGVGTRRVCPLDVGGARPLAEESRRRVSSADLPGRTRNGVAPVVDGPRRAAGGGERGSYLGLAPRRRLPGTVIDGLFCTIYALVSPGAIAFLPRGHLSFARKETHGQSKEIRAGRRQERRRVAL
jgi:hypothetical protein